MVRQSYCLLRELLKSIESSSRWIWKSVWFCHKYQAAKIDRKSISLPQIRIKDQKLLKRLDCYCEREKSICKSSTNRLTVLKLRWKRQGSSNWNQIPSISSTNWSNVKSGYWCPWPLVHEHLQDSSNLKYKTWKNIFKNQARCDSRLIITESSSSGSYSASNSRFTMGFLKSH